MSKVTKVPCNLHHIVERIGDRVSVTQLTDTLYRPGRGQTRDRGEKFNLSLSHVTKNFFANSKSLSS